MILGVISFTFVVSNINSIISQNRKKFVQQEKNLIFLDKMKSKYNLSNELITMARKEVKSRSKFQKIESISDFLRIYPKNLKNELQLCMYRNNLSEINFFSGLPDEIIISIGQALKPIMYTPSNLFKYLFQIVSRLGS